MPQEDRKAMEGVSMAASISEIKALLENVESYSPTIPLTYQKYHEIIRQLIEELEASK
jgi:hypothetical protein